MGDGDSAISAFSSSLFFFDLGQMKATNRESVDWKKDESRFRNALDGAHSVK